MDELDPGMTRRQAHEVMSRHGLQAAAKVRRPAAGWPERGKTWADPESWAFRRERALGRRIESAESYDAHHGLLGLGYGVIFLFYDGREKLIDCYRYQVN